MDKNRCIEIVHDRAISILPHVVVTEVMPCEVCGKWARCELHHRKFRSRQGGWEPSNILLLCGYDHTLATHELAPAGVNVHSWEQPQWVPVKLWYTDEPVCLDNQGGYSPCCPVG